MFTNKKIIFFIFIFINNFVSASAGAQATPNNRLLPLSVAKVTNKHGRFDKMCNSKSLILTASCFLMSLLIGGEVGYNVSPTVDTDNNNVVNSSMFNCLFPDGSQTTNAHSLSSVEGMNWRMEISNCKGRLNFTSKVQAPLPNAKLYQLAFYMPEIIDFAGTYLVMQRCDYDTLNPVTTYCARTVNEPYEENDNGGQFIGEVMRSLRTGALKNKLRNSNHKNQKKVKPNFPKARNNTRKAFDRTNGLHKMQKGR